MPCNLAAAMISACRRAGIKPAVFQLCTVEGGTPVMAAALRVPPKRSMMCSAGFMCGVCAQLRTHRQAKLSHSHRAAFTNIIARWNAMGLEFKALNDPALDWVVYPAGQRRPDYRSSGPKRLMPQLQIKVPTLRRWGRKMAVVVDRAFFDSIGEMDNVADLSNADVAWFIVRFEEIEGQTKTRLVRDEVRYTTLERSVEGLTGGKPVPRSVFEDRINEKKNQPAPVTPVALDQKGSIIPDGEIEEGDSGETDISDDSEL
jgi:hypothetical protein